ncbi:hypothetical protein HIM_06351 [Hirsutella minnesotensis 3608]|uniref:Phenylacetate 2-hydroxylase n=1 Tax=Hirsutella minnesotensis 3608 TaxID=1043627 RepID=A0A0F7ZNU2_9HYPO|nr:hypothetical protein HIM_06351 [Hirsutella minnesotensis 3608]
MLHNLHHLLAAVTVVVVFFVARSLLATDIPKIKGLPEVPGLPILGSLWEFGTDHARVAQKWVRKCGPVFQTRFGNRRVIFVNSYDTVKHFWITNQAALMSRPLYHTFHSVVSSASVFTIGSSPWSESCKQRRKAMGTALNRPATQSYMPILDIESTVSIKELLRDCKGGAQGVNPNPYVQQFTLSTSLALNYGIWIHEGMGGELLKEITEVERGILALRSTSGFQDYVPLLRGWGAQNAAAKEYGARRDKYMTDLLDDLKRRIANGTDKSCITGNILKDPEAELNPDEIMSIGLSMLASSFTVPGNLIMSMAFLSTREGQAVQAKALAAIEEVYPNGEAWDMCLVEEKVPYVTAFIKETLRYWSVIPMCLPRTSIKDITYDGAVIPANTTFFMNAYAANYDEARFKTPYRFMPERYLDNHQTGMEHLSFGAGTRGCVGTNLANREMYTMLIRLITAFEMVPGRDAADAPVIDAIECNASPTSVALDPKPFKIGLRPRNEARLRQWIAAAEERNKGL